MVRIHTDTLREQVSSPAAGGTAGTNETIQADKTDTAGEESADE